MNYGAGLAVGLSLSNSNFSGKNIQMVILIMLLSGYIFQLLMLFTGCIDDVDTKKEFLLWCIPFYMPIMNMVKKFNRLK
jgi:hypothetical protein